MKIRDIALVALLLTTAAHAEVKVQPEDIYAWSLVTDPVVSPDGNRVLFTRAAFDRGQDRRTVELWLAHVDAAGAVIDKRLLVGRDSAPRQAVFSPDGSRIAYVAQHLGKAQIHVLALVEGLGKPITGGDLAPSGLTWSPDGRHIAFTDRVEAAPITIRGLPEKPRAPGNDSAADARIVTELFWRADGAGDIKPGADHLFMVDAASGQVTQLTSGSTDRIARDGGLDWTRDGRFILGSFSPDPINAPQESDLYRYPVAGGAPERLTNRPGTEFDPQVSPDGRTIAFRGAAASDQFYAMPGLWTTGTTPGAPVMHVSATLDRPVAAHRWQEDGRAILALYHDEGVTRVGALDPATGSNSVKVPMVGGTRLYLPSAGGGFSAARGTFAWTSGFTDRPAGLGVSKGAGETGSVDFNAAWAASRKPARIEEITVASRADGQRVQGWVAYPPDFDPKRRYPVILDIHGGPNTDYGPFFSVTHSLYAAAGYLVLFANPRGSIGYGNAFANAITRAYPGQDHDDLMSITDELAKRPYADARNLFIGGGSGGGVLTLWAIGKEPDKFRAAVALRPVVDWTNQVTTSDGTAFFMKHWMQATPWADPERYFKLSPFSQAGNIKTPTLLITGESDFRTPISQTEQMFGALKLRGVDARMIRLPGAGHGMGRPSQWLQSVLAPIQWFDERKVP